MDGNEIYIYILKENIQRIKTYHPKAVCSVAEMVGITPLAIRYNRVSMAVESPKMPLCCCNW